jgi:hypothetical protein
MRGTIEVTGTNPVETEISVAIGPAGVCRETWKRSVGRVIAMVEKRFGAAGSGFLSDRLIS